MTGCDDLSRWLDEGMPAEGAGEAREHVASCLVLAGLWSFGAVERLVRTLPARRA